MADKELQKNESIRVQYRVVDVEKSAICKTESKYTYFPDKFKLQEGTEVCVRFGGRRVNVSTDEQFDSVVSFMAGVRDDSAWTEDLWVTTFTTFTDDDEFNVWKDYETGKVRETPFNWGFGEPNGGMIENCAEIRISDKDSEGNRYGYLNDLACTNIIGVTCEDIGDVVLTLRGAANTSV